MSDEVLRDGDDLEPLDIGGPTAATESHAEDRETRRARPEPFERALGLLARARKGADAPAAPLMLFLGLSWFSTTAGLAGIIHASRGEVGLLWLPIGLFVFAATYMMQHFLEQLFQPVALFRRVSALVAYVVLMGFSASFGFGFYWNLLEARTQTFEIAREAVGEASTSIATARDSLERMESSVVRLRDRSQSLADLEQSDGGTCGGSGAPGLGPRFDFRTTEAAYYERAQVAISTERARINGRIDALGVELGRVDALARDSGLGEAAIGARAAELFAINMRVNQFSESFNAFRAGPDLTDMRGHFSERADQYARRDHVFEDDQGRRFGCYDPGMSADLAAVVAAIDALPVLPPVDIRSLEGSAATMEAFDRLWTSAAMTGRALIGMGVRAPDDRGGWAEGAAGLRRGDMMALATAVIVDLMILIFNLYHYRGTVFEGLAGRVRGVERKRMTLPAVLERLREMVEDPNFEVLQRYQIVRSAKRRYLIVPARPVTQDERIITGLANLLLSRGLAKRAAPWGMADEAKERLRDARRGEMGAEADAYDDDRVSVLRLHRAASDQELIEFLAHPMDRRAPIDL